MIPQGLKKLSEGIAMNGTTSSSNPLGSAQREHAGAKTFGKYEYQYHWALCKIFERHAQSQEYVVFVEYHEDVIIGDSLDSTSVKFDFNQVKNYETGKWTLNRILKRKSKQKGEKEPSILGKMMDGVKKKGLYDKLHSLGLVNTSGFDLEQLDKDLELSIICAGDLTPECLQKISDALKAEIGSDEVPKILRFILSDLTSVSFQDASIGRLANLIESKWPDSKYKPQSIYLSLMDDLHRKGMVAFDFSQWEECVQNKGLTSVDVQKVIDLYLQDPSAEADLSLFRSTLEMLSVKLPRRIPLVRAFRRYYQEQKYGRSMPYLNSCKSIGAAIDDVLDGPSADELTENASSFIPAITSALSDSARDAFPDEQTLEAAIIYELSKRL
ncbi:hypothetical protein CCL18_05395 [Pseudomonas syringae]|nr:hypothetical protein CCL18_13200 [Pseudomonas syringae]PBP61166.1 hypothetical protein CCL18_05395 [Pseudomonas syringae]